MGKRSDFPRIDKDCYDTPVEAIGPLLPHLDLTLPYAEPFAGQGNLIDHLRPHLTLVWCSDIAPRREGIPQADALNCVLGDARQFISNPPWSRKLLHELIVYLSDQGPTWLLFDSNWANTKQAHPFMERCRKIVAVGRLKWIPDSKHFGKDDCSWYLFDKPLAGSAPVFYGRGCLPPEAVRRPRRICHDCGVMIDRFGKWALRSRNGILTPVHLYCDNPSGRVPLGERVLAPIPLFEWNLPAAAAE